MQLSKSVAYYLRTMLFAALIPLVVGCGDNYNYYRFKNRAEDALHQRDYDQVAKYYSIIYERENLPEIDPERRFWAFYRLGVVAELTGDNRIAKGYYWGDQIEEGFYAENERINWLAHMGWKNIDDGKPSRTLEEILELELRQRPPIDFEQAPIKARRPVVLPKTRANTGTYSQSGPGQSRTFNRSLTLPPPGSREPFRVFY